MHGATTLKATQAHKCEDHRHDDKNVWPDELLRMMASEPMDTSAVVQEKWYSLGALSISRVAPYLPATTDHHSFKESARFPGMWGQVDILNPASITGVGRHVIKTAGSPEAKAQCLYEGTFNQDRREGFGRVFWTDGSYYIGEWQNDQRNGYGELHHSNGKTEKGKWTNNKCEVERTPGEEGEGEESENSQYSAGRNRQKHKKSNSNPARKSHIITTPGGAKKMNDQSSARREKSSHSPTRGGKGGKGRPTSARSKSKSQTRLTDDNFNQFLGF